MIGSSNTNQFKKFQIRWAEKLGYTDNPYPYTLDFYIFWLFYENTSLD